MSTGLLILRIVAGLLLAAHGSQKLFGWFGGYGIAGTGGWLESIGFKPGKAMAVVTGLAELLGGLALALGLLTPLAAAGMIGVMLVAIVVAHWKVGFFIFKPNQGWEYCASIAITAFVVALVGPGEWSLDNAFGLEWSNWWGGIEAASVGIVGALVQLAVCYRPAKPASV